MWRTVFGAALVGLLLAGCGEKGTNKAQARPSAPDVMKVKALHLVDAQGRVRAKLEMKRLNPKNPKDKAFPVLSLYDSRGNQSVELRAPDASSSLDFLSRRGVIASVGTFTSGTAYLELNAMNKGPDKSLRLTVSPEGKVRTRGLPKPDDDL